MKFICLALIITCLAGGVLSQCAEGCLSCEASSDNSTFSCKICDTYNYYYMFPGSDTCEKSEIRHCEVPSVNRLCLLCAAGYVQDEVAGKCVQVGGSDVKANCMRYDSSFACVECEEEHFIDGSACSPVTETLTRCKVYSTTDTCQTCEDGYFLVTADDNTQTCQSISQKSNCWRYSMVQCDECKTSTVKNPNFFLDQMISSSIIQENVQIASSEFVLSTSQGNLCVTPSDEFCTSTDSNTGACLACSTGYFLDSSKKCTKNPEDSIPNCGEYSSPGSCTRCEGDFYLMGNVCTPVTEVEHCVRYQSTSDACEECKPEYYVSGANCLVRSNVIIPGCETLTLNGDTCQTCQQGFVISADKSKCFAVIDNCQVAEEPSPPTPGQASYVCTTCNTDYYPSSDGSWCMLQYVGNCQTYTDNTNICTACVNGFYLDGKMCKPLEVANCASPNTTTIGNCDTCHTGYYKDNNKCYKITVENCLVMPTTSNSCAACKDTNLFYKTADGNCLPYDLEGCTNKDPADNKCLTCDTANNFVKVGDYCLQNPMLGCDTYNFTTKVCTTCSSGYYQDTAGNCQLHSVQNCNGEETDANECTACNAGYYLHLGACIPYDLPGCPVSSQSGGNANTCTASCESGFYSNGAGACLPYTFDVDKCSALSANSDECTTCNNDAGCSSNGGVCNTLYFKDDNTGICTEKTLPGCKELKEGDATKCHECMSGFFQTAADEPCQPYTAANCATYNNTQDKCATCLPNYLMEPNEGTCVLSSIRGCITYKSSDLTQCDTSGCAFGYKENGGVCELDTGSTGCIFMNAQLQCQHCIEGMYFDNFSCNEYTFDTRNCIAFKWDANECSQCAQGYYWDSGNSKCSVNNQEGCYEFTSASAGCAKCIPGKAYVSGSPSTCSTQATVMWDSNCLYSTNAEGKCNTCKDGYQLVRNFQQKVTDPNCQEFNVSSGECNLCKPLFKFDNTSKKCIEPTGTLLCSQADSANKTDDLTALTNCTRCITPESQVFTAGTPPTCPDRAKYILDCEEYKLDSDSCKVCEEGFNLNTGVSGKKVGICQKMEPNNLATWPSGDEANCFAAKASTFGQSLATGAFVDCSICKPGFYNDTGNDGATNANCTADTATGATDAVFGTTETYSPIVLTAATTAIANCEKSVVISVNGTSNTMLLCAKCKQGFTGTIEATSYIGGSYIDALGEFDIYGNGYLYSACATSSDSLGNIGLTGGTSGTALTDDTLTNCETHIILKDTRAGYADDNETDVCYKCKYGYETVVNAFDASGSTAVAVAQDAHKIVTHFTCANRNLNLDKKYKGNRRMKEDVPSFDISHAVAHDSCKNGEFFGVFAKKIDGHYYPTGTSAIGNKFEVCAPKFKSVIENCQINIFEYDPAKSDFTDYDAVSCMACKPGYTWDSQNSYDSCVPIENCNRDADNNTWMNACETCNEGFIWQYNRGDKRIMLDRCYADNGMENCQVIDNQNACRICKKGYDMISGKCISIVENYSRCEKPGFGMHDVDAATDAETFANNSGFFLHFYGDVPPIFGCGGCSPGYMVSEFQSSDEAVCYTASWNKDLIPNCKKYDYMLNGTATCSLCEDGYYAIEDSTKCFKLDNIHEACIGIFGSCDKCKEGYTSLKLAIDGPRPFNYYCLLDKYLLNPISGVSLQEPYYIEGYRPMDYQFNPATMIPIEDDNPCAQYAMNVCIKCKEPGTVPTTLKDYLSANITKTWCVPYDDYEDVWPLYIENQGYKYAMDFQFKGITSVHPIGDFFLKNEESYLCVEYDSNDPMCHLGGILNCRECEPGYYHQNPGNHCSRIPVDHCLAYREGVCTECEGNYYVNSSACSERTKINCKVFSIMEDKCAECHSGYFINSSGACTKGTKQNCASLSTFGDYCLECVRGFYNNNGTCVISKKLNCKTYFTTKDLCKECNHGFFLKGGVCTPHTAQNCLDFRKDLDQCETCPEGLFLDDTLECSLPQQNNCLEYHPFEDMCLSCPEGYFLKDGGCSRYSVKNCKVFSAILDSCLQCVPGQYMRNDNSSGNDCLDYTVSKCAVHDPFNDRCLSCVAGHYNDGGKCKSYAVDNCILRNPFRDECMICKEGFVLGTGSQCVIQVVQNCKTYLNHIAGCSVCNEGFFLNNTHDCIPYTIPKCNTFSRTEDKCLVCSSETFLSDGKCKSYTAQYCRNYHPYKNECLSCREGFYMDNSASCHPYSLHNCLERNEYSNTCIKCEDSYYLDTNSECQKHSTVCGVYDMYRDKCVSCAEGMHLDVNRQCKDNTVDNCKTYVQNKNQCHTCEDHKWMSDNLCYDYTAKNCKTFKPDENLCEECVGNGYFKNVSGSCIPSTPVDHCDIYSTSTDQCDTCDSGYYKVSSSECRANPTGVKECLEYVDKETCKRCKPDHYLMENVCYESSVLVADCVDYVSNGICSLCGTGKVLDFNNTCVDPVNTTCATHENPKNCKTCGENQVLKSVTTGSGDTEETVLNCVDSGIQDCIVASVSGSTNKCTTCRDGFILSSTSEACNAPATTISGCLRYVKEGECERCEDEKILSADKSACDSDMSGVNSNCLVGHANEKPQCYQCSPGYWFNEDGNCEKCGGDGCDICTKDGKGCQVCAKGYYMTTQLTCREYSTTTTNRVVSDEGSGETQSQYEGSSLLSMNLFMIFAGLVLSRLA